VGSGPRDLIFIQGWLSHLDFLWEDPFLARFFERLASFARLILFDKRGTGLSDRVAEAQLPTLEQRMDDVRAVMEAAGSERAALMGVSEGGPMSMLFAATYPDRVDALVMYASYAKWVKDADYPWAPTREDHENVAQIYERRWGEPLGIGTFAPSMRHDEGFKQGWARVLRAAASPAAAVALYRMNVDIDVRHVLPAIRVPTLLLHRTGDRVIDVNASRYLASRIASAKFVELPGDDHHFCVGDWQAIVGEAEEFLTGARPPSETDRILATVLFTDIVGSTGRAAELGDRAWRDVLERHHAAVRRELVRFRGREVDTAGDGFLAAFDGPARAVRAALAIGAAVPPLGLQVRIGLHTGECEVLGDKLSGIAVHIGARVAALAGPGEVLVSSTVKDLVAGSGLRFRARGAHELKGVPGAWQLYSVERD
jgi:class 3 adenylate cyclase/pimeloyl-ACP methyl ester carboxylesterase